MNNKVLKYKSEFSNKEITFTIDKSLNKLKGKELAPKKVELANMIFSKIKSPLPC